MISFRSTPHQMTGETANFLMMGREVRLPEELIAEEKMPKETTVAEYVDDLRELMEEAGNRMRRHQYEVRTEEMEEPPQYLVGDLVWIRSMMRRKGESPKLAFKYIGPYEIIEVLPYHTYRMRKDGKESLQHEARIKLYVERTGKKRPKQIPLEPDTDDNIPLAELVTRRNVWKSAAEDKRKSRDRPDSPQEEPPASRSTVRITPRNQVITGIGGQLRQYHQ
jgi:hypothetical protein